MIPAERVVDPGGRDDCRAPVPWTAAPDHGWGVEDPWLPWPPGPEVRNAESLRADPASILHLYRRLLAAPGRVPPCGGGTSSYCLLRAWSPTNAARTPRGARRRGGYRRRVLVNFGSEAAGVPVDGRWTVEVAGGGEEAGEGSPYEGVVPGDAVVVLRSS